MSTQTPPKERSVPKPVFTDAEAGAREFPSWQSRTFNYFKPHKRRATVYEDVTVDVQPDPERYLSQGWIYGFANGPGGYPKEWTALKSSNWHEFLDPNEEWEQTIYRNNANIVRQVTQNVANAKAEHAFDRWNRSWIKVVEHHVGAWAHAENGIGLHVYTALQRNAPTNMINNAIAVGAAHKLRFAQDLILYNLELSEELDGFDGSAHRAAWQEDPVWQGVRENVERLTATPDWAEAFFATAIVFEPLVGELFRSHFVMQCAALQGDFVTPSLMGIGEADAHRDERGARRLFELLLKDPEYAGENRALAQDWLATWVPRSVEAARQLQPVWSQVSEKVVTFEDSLERATARFGDLLDVLGLNADKEL
jgi:propane monooxygenase small subunit